MSEKELLAEIHEKCLNYLATASLRGLPDSIHAEGMRAGLEEIKAMTLAAYSEAMDD